MVSPPPPSRLPRGPVTAVRRSRGASSSALRFWKLWLFASARWVQDARARTRTCTRSLPEPLCLSLTPRVKMAEEIPADRVGVRLTWRSKGRYRVNSPECTADTPGHSFVFTARRTKERRREGVIHVRRHLRDTPQQIHLVGDPVSPH